MTSSPLKSTQAHYDLLTRFFHWVIAFTIIYNTIAGYTMFVLEETYPVIYQFIGDINVSLASVVAILFIFRWIWSHFRQEPDSSSGLPLLQKKIANIVHSTLYLNMFIVYLSGFLMLEHSFEIFWLFELPNPITTPEINHFFFIIHRYSCICLAIFMLVHIAAALKHHLIEKNNVLIRMLGPKFILRKTI
ncbi:cytochrome b [Shewanella psychropiezotolerans]|uniref:Cytochrome b n=1 Tax=Shewanella psychropiezotolerans TaxID=2593655 RepID=A0ABX5WWC7_9GAMM|nr:MULTISPECIES: cytochrome b/b6 domain-containing protein [Shewanella]MPY23038.1 cytochrome b [Shewanella sp. YLB-07]QDO82697.1 cytochrome b [Shewanella psychropiezotolerans]